MKIREIVRVTRGKLLSGDPDTDVDLSRISTDSRIIGRGGLFIALKGPNFDGGRFITESFSKGAIGAVASSGKPSGTKIFIKVKDATDAFGRIAAAHRDKFRIPVIGIGGIMDYKDAVEFMLCGASAIQVGTANFINPAASTGIVKGIEGYMAKNGIKEIKNLVGALKT